MPSNFLRLCHLILVLDTFAMEEAPGQCQDGMDECKLGTGGGHTRWHEVCKQQHTTEDAKSLCQHVASVLQSRCTVDRIDARERGSWDKYLQHARSGVPFIMSHMRPQDVYNYSVDSILAKARGGVVVDKSGGDAVPERKKIGFSQYLSEMRRSQNAVVASSKAPLQNLDSDADYPANNEISYLFPGDVASRLFPNISDSFGDTRVVVDGQIRYDHAGGGSAVNMNGAFMGLAFHFHTSVFHEVVQGAKHFFFYDAKARPPFGVGSIYKEQDPKFHTTVHEWLVSGQYSGMLPEQRPTWECTLGAGDMIFVPYKAQHATYNLAPTLSLIRSGCNGMIPNIRKEVLVPQCPGPAPPRGKAEWTAQDFIDPPLQDVQDAKHVGLIYKSFEAIADPRDWRVKFIVFSDEADEGVKALGRASKLKKLIMRAYEPGQAPFVWIHVPCGASQNFCNFAQGDLPKLMVEARALGLPDVQDLGRGVSKKRVEGFLKKVKVQVQQLASRLKGDGA